MRQVTAYLRSRLQRPLGGNPHKEVSGYRGHVLFSIEALTYPDVASTMNQERALPHIHKLIQAEREAEKVRNRFQINPFSGDLA